MAPDAFYEPDGPGRFVATTATAGPWDAGAQHAGPPSALLARAFEVHDPAAGQRLHRVTVDILRPVPVAPLRVRVRTVRPGRRITLLEAVAEAGGQEVLHARGWRIAVGDSPATGDDYAVPALPPTVQPQDWAGAHAAGYLSAMEWRFAGGGGFAVPGPAKVWMRPRVPLVAGEETSPVSRVLLVADSGNGVSAVLRPTEWLFVNVDLTVALHRPPRGEWVLLDARTAIGPDGSGVAASRLADRDGEVGRGLQTLVVTRRSM